MSYAEQRIVEDDVLCAIDETSSMSRNIDHRGGPGYRPYPPGPDRYQSDSYNARGWDRPGPSDRDREDGRYEGDRRWNAYDRERYTDRGRHTDRDRQAADIDPRGPRSDFRGPAEYDARERRRFAEDDVRRTPPAAAYGRDERQRTFVEDVNRRESEQRDFRARRPSPPSRPPPTGPRNDPVYTSYRTASQQPYEHVDARYGQQRSVSHAYAERAERVQDVPPDAPTGPRRSLAGPPATNPYATANQARDYTERQAPHTAHRPSYDGANLRPTPQERFASSQTMDRSPISAGSTDATPSHPNESRRSTSHLPLHAQLLSGSAPLPASSSMPTTPTDVKPTFVGGKRIRWDEEEIKGSAAPKLEAEAYTHTLNRITSLNAFHAQPELQALRKALHDVADSDVELAGARVKATLTEAALERAKEQAEAWSIESGRSELDYRNRGSQAYWSTTATTTTSAGGIV